MTSPADSAPIETHPVMAGCEAWQQRGSNGHGVLVLHGFTGNPASMRALAESFASAGYHVSLPRLPGHGTDVEDMLRTDWSDWSGEAERALIELRGAVGSEGKVFVCGLSMGGTLTAWLATRHADLAGIITINGALEPVAAEFTELLDGIAASGTEVMPGIGSDIAKPGVSESAYPGSPVRPLLSLLAAGKELVERLPSITCPALVMHSPQDHVVPPSAADYFSARITGPVERVVLERSYHVATLDYDAELVEHSAVAFADRIVQAN